LTSGCDGLGDSVEALLESLVGERIASNQGGGVPAGGEQRIAIAQRVGGLLGEPGIGQGQADPPGIGEHLQEELAREGSPAVAAGAVGGEAADELGERLRIAAKIGGDIGEPLRAELRGHGIRIARFGCIERGFRVVSQPGERRAMGGRAGAG
jgi:hypothetical protein